MGLLLLTALVSLFIVIAAIAVGTTDVTDMLPSLLTSSGTSDVGIVVKSQQTGAAASESKHDKSMMASSASAKSSRRRALEEQEMQSSLSSSSSSSSAHDKETFDWSITRHGAPVVNFGGDGGGSGTDNKRNDIVLKYEHTGTLSEDRFLNATLKQHDCFKESDGALRLDTKYDDKTKLYEVDVDVDPSTIVNSVHYYSHDDDDDAAATTTAASTANIAFCVRIDYYIRYDGELMSINFYENKLNVTVNMATNFTMKGVAVEGVVAVNGTGEDEDVDEAQRRKRRRT